MAHGHFALAGGFTVAILPTTNDAPSQNESQEFRKVASLTPQELFPLFEKEDPRKARFDLFTQPSDVQIKQLHEYSYTSTLVTIALRLLVFVYFCCRRQSLGFEMSPLEVVTVGHVFMAVLIDIFWWDRPPYLRLPVHNLDRRALCEAIPGLEKKLDDLAEAEGKKVALAYMWSKFKLLQWLPGQDNGVGLRIHANYRAIIVFGLSACHSAILLFPDWRLSFPTPTESQLWHGFLKTSFGLSTAVAALAALDTLARHISAKYPKFKDHYGVILDGTLTEVQRRGAASIARDVFNAFLLPLAIPILACITVAVVVAGSNFRQAAEGVYVLGPGDVAIF
jgi:hypothetical protein